MLQVSTRLSGLSAAPRAHALPSEAVFDKITKSASEGTLLNIALRDCGITAFLIVGVAMEVGIEPTVRHGADLGYVPIVVTDACGCGHAEAAERSLASLRYTGDALFTDVAEICDVSLANCCVLRISARYLPGSIVACVTWPSSFSIC